MKYYNKDIKLIFSFSFLFVISINPVKCITQKIVNSLSKKITEENLEKEILNINNIIKEFDAFNEKYNSLTEKENEEKKENNFDEKKYKEEYKNMYKEANIFKDYFFKQRSKMSNYINMPKGKIEQNIYDAYHSTVEYSLECQDLIKNLEQKTNTNKEDL